MNETYRWFQVEFLDSHGEANDKQTSDVQKLQVEPEESAVFEYSEISDGCFQGINELDADNPGTPPAASGEKRASCSDMQISNGNPPPDKPSADESEI